jgi:hypothetical protein
MPATALFCIDGSSGPEVAFELKSLMDIAERHDMAALVVNAHTQRSTSDCPIYAMFHAGKLRAMAAGPAFDEMLDRLLENSVNPAAYRLPWGSEHGSRVHYIENDSHPESRLLPPSILKEMQSRKGLQDLVDERQWQSTAVNKKGQTALARYAASYVGVQGQSGRSTSMTDKAIKYFGRARRVLDNVKLLYGRDEGNDLLRQMLGEIRSKGTRNPVTARERMAIVTRQIAACKDNIALLDLARETHEVSHLRYLIDKELISRESDDEDDWSVDSSESIIDEADLPKIKEYAAMTSSELEALDEALLRDQEALRAGFRTREAGSGRFDHMQHTYESNGVTAESEALRLAELQAWLAREHGASIDP